MRMDWDGFKEASVAKQYWEDPDDDDDTFSCEREYILHCIHYLKRTKEMIRMRSSETPQQRQETRKIEAGASEKTMKGKIKGKKKKKGKR